MEYDNSRHATVLGAASELRAYADARVASAAHSAAHSAGPTREEDEQRRTTLVSHELAYNAARFYHALGLLPQAAERYEEALRLADALDERHPNAHNTLKRNAAHNLAIIYLKQHRAAPNARKLIDKYLTIH